MAYSQRKLDSVWTKAALLGSLWGSIEIIIGSFLHNLRVPLTGTILSAIGVALLVGGHFIFREKGIVWRAGLICALMKSVSPSAVILGPMLGIVSEAIILELFIKISRGTTIGLLVGSAIAVCLPFLQSIISLILTYGFNIAALYTEVYKIVVKNLGIRDIDILTAVAIFLSLNALFGLAASILGIRIGKHALEKDSSPTMHRKPEGAVLPYARVDENQRFSVLLLFINVMLIPIILFMSGKLELQWWAVIVGLYIIAMVILYPNTWRRFSKPKLWAEMIFITIVSGFVLGEFTTPQPGLNWNGIFIGFGMSARAVFMVVAFNVISIELRNPVIINWIMRRGFGQLAPAMEVAFDILPSMTAALGEQKKVLRHPVISLSHMLRIAKERLRTIEGEMGARPEVIIVTGARGSGKTQMLMKLVNVLGKENIRVGGILSAVVYEHSTRIGYDIINIRTDERRPLCRTYGNDGGPHVGDFTFINDGISVGIEALSIIESSVPDLIIVDEVGPLEMKGSGWALSLDRLMTQASIPILLVVRGQLIENVTARWGFQPEAVIAMDGNETEEIIETIQNIITRN